MMRLLSIISLLFIFGCSCSDEPLVEPTYSKSDIMFKIIKADPNAREVLPKDMNSGIKCSDYGTGCIRGYVGKIVGYEMTFVEFETPSMARAEALRVKQLYTRNWLLDDVKGEPPLEKFFKQVFNAIDPYQKTTGDLLKTSGEKSQSSPSK